MGNLSERETEVYKLLLEGKTVKDIADILILSTSTVATHRNSIYKKLVVNSQYQLIAQQFQEYRNKLDNILTKYDEALAAGKWEDLKDDGEINSYKVYNDSEYEDLKKVFDDIEELVYD